MKPNIAWEQPIESACESMSHSSGTSGSAVGQTDEPTSMPAPQAAFLNPLSPSLHSRRLQGLPAREMKFLLSPRLANEVEAWSHERMVLDPNTTPHLPSYQVTSISFDTAGLDVMHYGREFSPHKYRVRRYGNESQVYLERKTRYGDRIEKRRLAIPLVEGHLPLTGDGDHGGSSDNWFTRETEESGLTPACKITYARSAFVESGHAGPIRMTLDRGVRAAAVCSTDFAEGPLAARSQGEFLEGTDGDLFLNDRVVLELKFLGHLPVLFKLLLERFQLSPISLSKYRRWGRSRRVHSAPHRQGDSLTHGGTSVASPAATKVSAASIVRDEGE